MQRAAQVTVEILEGAETMATGLSTARRLWNATWWCLIGYNQRLRRQRGDSYETFKRLRPRGYPGNFTMQKELKDHPAYRDLSDRCASYTVKDFDIAMRSWFSNLKRNPDARPPRPLPRDAGRTLTFEVGRNAKSLGAWEYRLTVLGGHIAARHARVRIHLQPGVKMAQVGLIRISSQTTRRGWYRASLILDLPAPQLDPDRPEHYAGLDLGIINIGALACDDGATILYNGRGLLDELRQGEIHAARCKPAGWVPGKKRLPPSARQLSYRRHTANSLRLAIHNFTTSVIRECQAHGITHLAVGDLTGIRTDKDFGKAGNLKFHRWPHLEIRRQLAYKAEEVGIELDQISEAYTSQTCCRCGVISRQNRIERGLYACRDCGLVINADVNGAINILRRVSPEAKAEGVEAVFPSLPSLTAGTSGTGEPRPAHAHHPTLTADFDLRNWAVVLSRRLAEEQRCNG